jgi:hypothetical protein
MAIATEAFTAWLQQADIPAQRLTPALTALLHAVFRFRHAQGCDYYSTRLLSHFLLHADTSLKVAQIARLLGISRPNASKQQKLSSKQVIQQAHHRLDGRPYGKLLPRYAGAIAAFLLGQPSASRVQLIDFVERTFGVRVSRVALHKFLKKYGLGVYDEMLDGVPCGYDKDSADPKRPRWQRGGMQMVGWLIALVYNAVGNLAVELAGEYNRSHVRTVRRNVFNRPGTLYLTAEALIVSLDPFGGQEALLPVIDAFNQEGHRLPWLDNRRVVLCLSLQTPHHAPP